MGQFQDISLAQVTVLHDPMNIHIKMPLVTANYIKFGVSIEILQLLLDYPATSHNKIRQESSRESCWAHPIRPIPTIPCPLSSPAFKSTPCPWRPSKSCHRAKTGTASQRVQDISGHFRGPSNSLPMPHQVKLRPSEIFIKQPVSLPSGNLT